MWLVSHSRLCDLCTMIIEQHRARIKALLAQPHMTKALLASKAGVHRNSLNGLESASWDPRTSTLEAIMDAVRRLEK